MLPGTIKICILTKQINDIFYRNSYLPKVVLLPANPIEFIDDMYHINNKIRNLKLK